MRLYYADDVARRIGDVLTIQITENSLVDNKGKRNLQRNTDRSMTFNGEVGKFTDLGEFGFAAKSDSKLDAKADFKDDRKFSDWISVVVVDILPNGSLVVMGSRTRNIAGDIQKINASGIVNPRDISFSNVVDSRKVANFEIVSENKGVAAPYTKQGWLGRIFDLVLPL
jgi:flagellar L-ring protein precursor FlgH